MAALMWLWDLYDKQTQPPLDYDPPAPNYFADWVFLAMIAALYGFTFGQALYWLSRRLKTRKWLVFVTANLLCGIVFGLALNYWRTSQTADDPGHDTLVDYGFLFLLTCGGTALWSLIFLCVRRPDRDTPLSLPHLDKPF